LFPEAFRRSADVPFCILTSAHTHTRTHARAHAHTQARWGPALLTKLQFMISEKNRQYSNIDKQDRHQEAAAAEAGKIPSLDVRYDGVWDSLLRRYRNTCVSYRRAPRLRLLKLRGILSASLFLENASCRGAIAYILPLFPCTRPTIQSLNGILLGKEREFTYSTSKPVTARMIACVASMPPCQGERLAFLWLQIKQVCYFTESS